MWMYVCIFFLFIFFSTINANHFLCDYLPEMVHNWMNKIFYILYNINAVQGKISKRQPLLKDIAFFLNSIIYIMCI